MKSCVLLAGLYAQDGPTVVIEHGAPSRDHTERMLRAMGARVEWSPHQASVWPVDRLEPLDVELPGEFIGGAADRRGDAARGIGAAHPRRQSQPDAHRSARRPRADGRAHHDLQQAHARGRAGRRPRDPLRGADGDGDRGGRGPESRRRAAGLRARRGDGAGRKRRPRRGGVAREGDGSHRDRHDVAEESRRSHQRARGRLRRARRADAPEGRRDDERRRPQARDARRDLGARLARGSGGRGRRRRPL